MRRRVLESERDGKKTNEHFQTANLQTRDDERHAHAFGVIFTTVRRSQRSEKGGNVFNKTKRNFSFSSLAMETRRYAHLRLRPHDVVSSFTEQNKKAWNMDELPKRD